MACDERQLSQQQREAAFNQNRTGVPNALREFRGNATPESLAAYLNREVFPVLSRMRNAVNEVYLQVADNAPSANPLGYYFSTETANADPTIGRVRGDATPQNTIGTLRVSQSNGRRIDVAPWLDVMAGSATSPLGVVTLTHAINPARFIRFDLTAMADQGAYWDLAVSPVESSHDNPFVDGDQITLGFIAGVSSGTTTVSPSAITPIADETFLGNVSGGVAAPSAVGLSTLAGGGLTWDAANNELDVGAGTRITVNANDVQLAAGAADSFMMNATAGVAVADYRAGTSVAGAGLTYTTGGTLAVGSSTSITVNADDVQRSALTGDITAVLNSNTTAFRSFTARSVLANATNAGAVPTELQGTTAHHVLKVNSGGTAILFEGLTLAAFPTIADDTFLANISGATAVPSAVALTTLAGAGLTGGADAILNVGAGTRITVNANDVQLAAGAAESFLGNFTAGSAVADYRAGSSVAGAGLTYSAGGTLAVGGSTSITVNADDIQRAALTGAIAASANSNATLFAGILDNGVAENDRQNLNFLTSTSVIAVITDDSVNNELELTWERAALTGDVTASQNSNATTIANDAVTFAKMQNIATDTLIGRDAAGTGDPENITLGNGLEMTGTGALRVDEDDGFNWQGTHVFNGDVTLTNSEIFAALQYTASASITVNSATINDATVTPGGSREGTSIILISSTADTNVLAGITNPLGTSHPGLYFCWNNDTTDGFVLGHERASSTASARFTCPNNEDMFVPPGGGFIIHYNTSGTRWRVLALNERSYAANTVVARASSAAGQAAGIALGNEEIIGRLNANITNIQLGTLGGAGVAWSASNDRFELVAVTQAEQETGTATATGAVTPGRQQFHPSACKAWGSVSGSSTTIFASYNVTSEAHTGTGVTTVTIATDFSSANYAPVVTNSNAAGVALISYVDSGAVTAGTFVIRTVRVNSTAAATGTAADPGALTFACFGDQ